MIFKAYHQNILSDFDLNLPKSSGVIDVEIKSKKIVLPKLEPTKIFRKNIQAFYGRTQESHFLHWPEIVTVEITENFLYYQTLNNIQPDLLRIFLLSEAFGIILHNKGIFLLHASAVVINNQAHVFMGEPGAGKSTMIAAFGLSGFKILSDDLVAIKINENNIPVVFPSFPEIKIWKQTAENFGLVTKKLKPAWEGKEKYLLENTYVDFEESPALISNIKILSIEKDDTPIIAAIELLKFWPLPHQILETEAIISHFNMSAIIAQNSKIEKLKRHANFEELIKYVNSFL